MRHIRIPDAVHQELLNWSRWCWQGEWPHPLPATHCGSLESGYRAPPDWNPDDDPAPLPIKPNERNARMVQEVYDAETQETRQVMKAEYPCRREHQSRQAAAASIGIAEWLYEEILEHAIRRVEVAFAVCA